MFSAVPLPHLSGTLGAPSQTLKVGEKYHFPQLSEEVRSSGTLERCTKALFLIQIWSIDNSEYGKSLFPPQCEETG